MDESEPRGRLLCRNVDTEQGEPAQRRDDEQHEGDDGSGRGMDNRIDQQKHE